jgi:hypothetical protein
MAVHDVQTSSIFVRQGQSSPWHTLHFLAGAGPTCTVQVVWG